MAQGGLSQPPPPPLFDPSFPALLDQGLAEMALQLPTVVCWMQMQFNLISPHFPTVNIGAPHRSQKCRTMPRAYTFSPHFAAFSGHARLAN